MYQSAALHVHDAVDYSAFAFVFIHASRGFESRERLLMAHWTRLGLLPACLVATVNLECAPVAPHHCECRKLVLKWLMVFLKPFSVYSTMDS